mmetsp:Transcript_12904/g.11026  ORF Transcript_12904/g.11026 Transcript_12904/m.11026 type:complete len:82 (-) Transcript_12904:190-435(-)
MNSPEKRKIEKEYLMKGPKSLTIKELLQIPSELRTFQHCKEIINHVKNVKFLERYMDSDQIFDLAKEFRMESYPENHVVFR